MANWDTVLLLTFTVFYDFPILTVPCLSNFTAPMGTVLSPDYPEGYGNN